MFVVLFPVVEETLFRGFLFTGSAQSWGPSVAGVLTTLVFVAVHMPKVLEYWPALVAVTLIGTLTVFSSAFAQAAWPLESRCIVPIMAHWSPPHFLPNLL